MPKPDKSAVVEKGLTNAVQALQDAKKLAKAARKTPASGVTARKRVDAAIKALGPLLRFKSLGPDTGEGPLNKTNSGL